MPPTTPFYSTNMLPPQVAFFVMCGTLKRGKKGDGDRDGDRDGDSKKRFFGVIQVWKRPKNSQKRHKKHVFEGETTPLFVTYNRKTHIKTG